MDIVKKFLTGVPGQLIIGFVRTGLLAKLTPKTKGYATIKDELVALAKDVQEKWPSDFTDGE